MDSKNNNGSDKQQDLPLYDDAPSAPPPRILLRRAEPPPIRFEDQHSTTTLPAHVDSQEDLANPWETTGELRFIETASRAPVAPKISPAAAPLPAAAPPSATEVLADIAEAVAPKPPKVLLRKPEPVSEEADQPSTTQVFAFVEENTIGKFLQDARRAKGRTVTELARTTNISATHINALESNDLNALPEPVYVLKHIKSLCDQLGANYDEAANVYRRQAGVDLSASGANLRPPLTSPDGLSMDSHRFPVFKLTAIVAGSTLVILVIVAFVFKVVLKEHAVIPPGQELILQDWRNTNTPALPCPNLKAPPPDAAPAPRTATTAPRTTTTAPRSR